jgi:hypothetical protein
VAAQVVASRVVLISRKLSMRQEVFRAQDKVMNEGLAHILLASVRF